MGSCSLTTGASHEIAWFSDADRAGKMERLTAVVVRLPDGATAPHARRDQASARAASETVRSAEDLLGD